ncbi:MAG: NAD-dependent deacylase [Armatimonadia bacterium]
MLHNDLQAAAEALADRLSSDSLIVASTGAGMSRESGIPTFRGAEGVWRQYRAEDVATPEAFRQAPKLFWEFNDHLRQLIAAAAPNGGHFALARFRGALSGAELHIITQNIDRLHENAGSTGVIHLHGDILRVVCPSCGFADDDYPVPAPDCPPVCSCGKYLRPDIVLFGEPLPEEDLERSFALAETCDAMLVVGTSMNVQPAASLPFVALEHGALVVEVNPERTTLTSSAHHSLRGTAAEVLPPLLELITELRTGGAE